MTDAELLLVHYEIQEALAVSMFNYVSIISAALVGSYLAADKLDRIMVGLVLFVFTASCIGFTMEGYQLGVDLAGAALAINAASLDPNSTLGWTSFAQGMTVDHVPLGMWSFFSALYLSVIVFFFRLRWARFKKRGTKRAELGEL